jgi:hypothetical protein
MAGQDEGEHPSKSICQNSAGGDLTMSQTHGSDTPTAGNANEPSGHGSSHGHDEAALGPVDWPAWGAGLLGVALGLAVAWAFVLANLFATAR